MSHHFSSPTAIADGRLNLLDLYVFSAVPGTSTLILTVNPDSGLSSPTTFLEGAFYEFVVASDGTTGGDRIWRMSFGAADEGAQEMQVHYFIGAEPVRLDGTELGIGHARKTFTLRGGGLAWFGQAHDPFWGDAPALFAFQKGLAENAFRPELFTATPANLLADRNVTAIALQVPDIAFGGTDVTIWARIRLAAHRPERQVSRAANPLLPSLFFPMRGADNEALNAGSPGNDVAVFGEAVRQTATNVARLSLATNADEHAETVVAAFLPDMLRYQPGQPVRFAPGTGNGRGLHDDAFGTALSSLIGRQLGITDSPNPVVPTFPHLAPAGNRDIAPLAELLGLRGQHAH